MPIEVPALTWDALKRRLKGLQQDADPLSRNWHIRAHRAISWLKQATELPESQPDARLLLLWISLNTLYSAWENVRNEPQRDSYARREFVAWLVRASPKKVAGYLRDQRPALRRLLSDPCLSSTFWRNPHDPETEQLAGADGRSFDADLRTGNHHRVLENVLERLFVLRSQIVHGASTAGSRLNRAAVNDSLTLLERLVPVIIHLVLEHGSQRKWPELCYPPLE